MENQEYHNLTRHLGHDIQCVMYGNEVNVSLECEDCNEVLRSEDRITEE